MKRVLSIVVLALSVNALNAQTPIQQPATPIAISLTAENVAYTQDFNTLTAGGTGEASYSHTALPNGWTFAEIGITHSADRINGKYSWGPGNSSIADTYSYGSTSTDPDRAFGSLVGKNSGGTVDFENIKIGAAFTNNTGEAITELSISYFGEQWRQGGSGIAGKLSFAYSTDATSLNSGTWANVASLDFTAQQTATTATQLDGNVAPNRTEKTYTITGLNIPNGATFWIRWENAILTGTTYKGDGLAVDDFSLIPNPSTQPVDLTFFNYQKSGNTVQLKWETASERDNDYFELFRSADGQNFTSITKINGKGNTAVGNSYSYTDFNPLGGTSYYQLKQVDYNGDTKTYSVLSVKFEERNLDFNVYSSGENAAVLRIYSPENSNAAIQVTDINGRELAKQQVALVKGYNNAKVVIPAIKPGVHMAIVSSAVGAVKKKFINK